MNRLTKAILPAMLGLAAYYAIFGGEHSVFDLWRARRDVREEQAELAELQERIDSLRAWADSLDVDSATLERIARERFGMVRDGETLYRFVTPPDSGVEVDTTDSGPR